MSCYILITSDVHLFVKFASVFDSLYLLFALLLHLHVINAAVSIIVFSFKTVYRERVLILVVITAAAAVVVVVFVVVVMCLCGVLLFPTVCASLFAA